jgi:DMSO/TMAO reductase YedYZ heme-binding membrane subunit
MARGGKLEGWPIVGWCSLTVLSASVLGLAVAGTGEDGVRLLVRITARTSFVLFMSAFVASACARAWRSDASRWLLRNRRQLGVSFAVSHFVHLIGFVTLGFVSPTFGRELDAGTIVGGGLAYAFLAAMTLTSFDRTAAWLGPKWWRRLHLIGAHYIWLIFFVSYLPRALVESVAYLPFVFVLLGGLVLRVAARYCVPVALRG